MKKLSLIGLFVLLSCSEAEKTAEPVVVNYTISVVATCPSTNKLYGIPALFSIPSKDD